MTKLTFKNTKKIISSATLITFFAGWRIACCNKSNEKSPKPLVKFKSSLDTNISNGNNRRINLKLVPVFENDVLFTSSFDGFISAVNANTGKLLWSTKTKLQLSSPVAVSNTTIVADSFCHTLVSVDKTLDKILWKSIFPSRQLSTPSIVNNVIYTQIHDGNIRAYNLKDSKKLWQATELKEPRPTAPLYIDKFIVISDDEGYIYIFNASTGKYLTRVKIRTYRFNATPISTRNSIIVQTNNGTLAAIKLLKEH